jgi:hypothetical protein
MSSKKQRFRYHLDSGGITRLEKGEIRAILRAADELVATGGRTILSKVLKGSRDKKAGEHGLGNRKENLCGGNAEEARGYP